MTATKVDSTYLGFGTDKYIRPSLQLRQLAGKISDCVFDLQLYLVYALKVSHDSLLHHLAQPFAVPSVCFQGLLEYFMENLAVDLRRTGFVGGLDTILEHGTTGTAKGISNDRGGDEMIRVKDEHVLRVINDALAGRGKVTNEMDMSPNRAGRVKPGLAKDDDLFDLCFLILDSKNLF